MGLARREFLKESLSALGFLALDGMPVFAAGAGWKPKGRPKLVAGILSDTHLQSGWDGATPHRGFPLTYVTNAMKLFRERNIDAFMHLGDAAHRGKNVEIKYHRDIFEKFFPRGKAMDGHTVEKLLVVGNHELYGDVAGGPGAWAPNIWKDPEERKKHVLCSDLPKQWEASWGEKYEEVWHKEVKGYHFFGRHWSTKEQTLADFINGKAEECSLKGDKPFFIMSHARNHFKCNQALSAYPNAIAFFGHWHQSNADWKTIYFDSFGGFFPNIQVASCRMDGGNALDANEHITKSDVFITEAERNSAWSETRNPSRQAMIMNVYEDMIVIERHEVGQGGRIGPDWVLPLGRHKPHPFSREELKKSVGKPQFARNAKLEVAVLSGAGAQRRGEKGQEASSPARLSVKIPMADGNPDSRVYAYDVVAVGDEPKTKLFKSVFFSGVNAGIGHEPNRGVTEVEIPIDELPSGKALTIAVRPISSLGTKGSAIATTFRPRASGVQNGAHTT